jgi:hypothetical protein
MYAWGLVGFTIAWFAFDMNSSSNWVTSAWWKDLYAVFGIGLLAAVVSLFPSLVLMQVLGSPLTAWYAGLGAGVVFGLQVNTIGVWLIPQPAVGYLSLVCCMCGGLFVVSAILAIWAAAKQATSIAPVHFASCWIGAWLLLHMVGVLVTNFPNVFAMSLPYAWSTSLYVACMWLLAALAFTVQWFAFNLGSTLQPRRTKPEPPPLSTTNNNNNNSRNSRRRMSQEDEDESRPLLVGEPSPQFGGEARSSLFAGAERYSTKRG